MLALQVYLYYNGSWLKVKEVYTIQPTTRKRRQRQPRSSPYGIVAESVDAPSIRGYKFSKEIKVPAMKVSRFAARLHLVSGIDAIVIIEEESLDSYRARIYAKSASELNKAVNIALEILSSLQAGRRRGTEEEETEAEEEGESEEE